MTAAVASPLPDALLTLLRGAAPCFVATAMPDGSPQLTETWVDTDGEHVVINTVEGFQKVRNLRRDPRVSLNVCDPGDVSRYFEVRGHVVDITAEGGGSTSRCSRSATPAGPTRTTAAVPASA